jgi:hypothetical protein
MSTAIEPHIKHHDGGIVAMKKILSHLLLIALFATSFSLVAQQRLDFDRHMSHAQLEQLTAPQSLQRRAADTLERQRTEGEGHWQEASLTGKATPLYRPDLDGPAFYEFEVAPTGFMILSTGDHDYPLTLLSKTAEQTITEQLTAMAEGREIAKFYALDAMAFAAESPEGELVSEYGSMPQRLIPLAPGEMQAPQSVESFLISEGDDDLEPEVITEEGPMVDVPYDIVPWESWKELKHEYAAVYGELLEQKREAAAHDWDTERLVQEMGEGIPVGTTFLVPLLSNDADFHVMGEGAELAEVTRMQRPGLADVITIQPFEAVEGADLTLEIFYADREPETQTYFFVNGGAGKNGWRTLVEMRMGTAADQRIYGQFKINGCWSGCGPTAWAMLLGWADNQAAQGNPKWRHRWGIYRENGGRGRDATAPRYQTQGVVNMQTEIKNHVGTFCAFGLGATLPTSMHFVSKYLRGRTGATERSTYFPFFNGKNDAIRTMLNNDVPVVIGTGFYSHYPLAWGYQYRTRIVRHCFIGCWESRETEEKLLINNGNFNHSNYNSYWLNTTSFFTGELKPN